MTKLDLRAVARVGIVPAALVGALALAGPASAHVSVSASETAAGAYTVLTVSVPHGCDGSPTTKVAIGMPDGVYSVTPTRNPFYDLEKVTEKLDQPVQDAHGNELIERVSRVVYTAETPLPDGERDSFELSLQLPEDAAGTTLAFPTIQTCKQGETAWSEVPASGQSADDLDHPAPAFEVTEAFGDGHGATTASDAGDSVTSDAAGAESEDDGNGIAIAGLVAGLFGLVLGAVALVRTRGRGQA